MLNNRWHYIIQMVLLLPVLGCLKSICLFTVHRLCPFSHSLGSIPLKCVYLCNLAHISSMLETNSNRMLSFSLLKESHKVHLLRSVFSKVINRWWGNLWVLTRQCYLQENATRSSGFLSCWHCQTDMYGGSVSVSCNYPLVSPTASHKACSSLSSHGGSSSTCVTWMRLETQSAPVGDRKLTLIVPVSWWNSLVYFFCWDPVNT